jgi:hypothetical protein
MDFANNLVYYPRPFHANQSCPFLTQSNLTQAELAPCLPTDPKVEDKCFM